MKLRKLLYIAALSVPLLLPSASFACRPMETEDYGVNALGQWSIESGIEMVANRDGSGMNTFDACLHYGLMDRLEVAVEAPYLGLNSDHLAVSGPADGFFHVKYNFLTLSDREGATFKLSYKIKSGDQDNGLGANENDITTMLVLTKDIGWFFMHLNFGYIFNDVPRGEEPDDQIIYNAAVQKELNDRLDIFTEITCQMPTLSTEDADIEYYSGIIYAINDSLTWDIGIGGGLNNSSCDSKFTTGLTVNF